MELNNIIFTSDSNIQVEKLGAINVIQNLNDLKIDSANPSEIIFIRDANHLIDHNDRNMGENMQFIKKIVIPPITDKQSIEKITIITQDERMLDELSKVCRCCLGEFADMQSIFNTEDDFHEMIMQLASVQVRFPLLCILSKIYLLDSFRRQISPDDGFPLHICGECAVQLVRAVSFKHQIETADAALRHFVSEGYMNGMKLTSLYSETLDSIG